MYELPGGTAPNGPMQDYVMLYPEVVQAGSLQRALQEVADAAGRGLVVELTSSPGWRHVAARVESGSHSACALLALDERCFIVDCWAGAVHMATGSTSDLAQVVGALHSWLERPRVGELIAQWPFLRTWELARAHERGEAVPVRWRQLREAAARTPHTGLHDLVEAAFEHERLRALSPGRSMHWLTFSRRPRRPSVKTCRKPCRSGTAGTGCGWPTDGCTR
ncbi:DUF6193 family natural product biosynthesis protein [Streptomyces sp. NBC_01336]|uniref:DUF6193 family natural product biosynthesis protein n=1 Tax=Streptomyces sp. NBC_01336 TaxID=2903829 RepID=UPI002E0E6C3C|nr:DUF6193 family natural product biosynthesis protein [Streptomyces sp. NBC_01336]